MERVAYLTIDDSPSPHTDKIVTYLAGHGIQALFFCIGEKIEAYPDQMIGAVQAGHALANHTYAHKRFSTLSLDVCIEEIERAETLIETIYKRAGRTQTGKYFRFPHMDRGTAGWVVDYDRIDEALRRDVTSLFADGLNITLEPPTHEMIEKKALLQEYLKKEGYQQPFKNIKHAWFEGTELESARDCMYTFSNSDWMLLDRHRGKWSYKTEQDLKDKIDDDKYLRDANSAHIILAHDKPEPELFPIFKTTVDHMINSGFKFVTI